jgi:hypothetical protein
MTNSPNTKKQLTLLIIGLGVVAWTTLTSCSLLDLRGLPTFYSSTTASTFFDRAVDEAFAETSRPVRRHFDVKTWNKTTEGGLQPKDRQMLGELYRNANSVFEYGLGESTYIADHVGVARYAGVDSDPVWVSSTRAKVSNHFRFYFADVGVTKLWGYPNDASLAKNIYQYQIAPLMSEPYPFDVYMVDGRWRLPCLLLSFLHASAKGGDPAATIVLLHDCLPPSQPVVGDRVVYRQADTLLDLVRHSGELLCAYQRKPTTTDADLWNLWQQYRDDIA